MDLLQRSNSDSYFLCAFTIVCDQRLQFIRRQQSNIPCGQRVNRVIESRTLAAPLFSVIFYIFAKMNKWNNRLASLTSAPDITCTAHYLFPLILWLISVLRSSYPFLFLFFSPSRVLMITLSLRFLSSPPPLPCDTRGVKIFETDLFRRPISLDGDFNLP